jgi:hypothetical protein
MTVTIKGRVHEIQPLKTFDSGFQKQTIVVNIGTRYDPYIPVDFKKENIDKVASIKVGDEIEVDAFLGGREYNGRYYVELTGFKVGGAQGPTTPNEVPGIEQSQDGLPF